MKAPNMKKRWQFHFGDEWPGNAYTARGECPNCRAKDTFDVRKGTPLKALKIVCDRCGAAHYTVRP